MLLRLSDTKMPCFNYNAVRQSDDFNRTTCANIKKIKELTEVLFKEAGNSVLTDGPSTSFRDLQPE